GVARRAVVLLGAVAVALLASMLVASLSVAATLPDAELTSARQVVSWSGVNADATGQGFGSPTPATCTTETCDSFLLTINVPTGTFPKGPRSPAPAGTTRTYAEGPTDMPGDGVLIAIRWATDF